MRYDGGTAWRYSCSDELHDCILVLWNMNVDIGFCEYVMAYVDICDEMCEYLMVYANM